jgi:hypothetical protein
LKLYYHTLLSNLAFNFKLRRYQLEKEREKYGGEASEATAKYLQALEAGSIHVPTFHINLRRFCH